MSTAFLFFVFVFASPGVASDLSAEVTRRFFKTVHFPFQSTQQVESVIYGNPEYGYFETRDFKNDGKELILNFLPPGYRYPIQFFVKGIDIQKKLGERKFSLQLPAWFRSMRPRLVQGRFASNYYLTDGRGVAPSSAKATDFKLERPRNLLYPMILNKFGEIVWVYYSEAGLEGGRTHILSKPLGDGKIGILFATQNTFEIVDLYGRKLLSHRVPPAEGNYVMHHDFLYSGDRILTFGKSKQYIRSFWRFVLPHAPGFKNTLLNYAGFFSRPEEYMTDSLEELNLTTGKVKRLWESSRDINPIVEMYRTKKIPHSDFLHANSIVPWKDGGYLLSLRNKSLLVLLDDKFHLKQRIDAEAGAFFHQHHATVTSEGTILVFDNGRESSRLVELNANTVPVSVKRYYYPNSRILSQTRGSSFEVRGGNIVGFFPEIANRTEGMDTLIEFDRQTGDERARMEIEYGWGPHGYRAEPMDTLGSEKFLGYEIGTLLDRSR